MLNDNDILTIFYNNEILNRSKINIKWISKHKDILEYLDNRYIDSYSYKETLYRIKNGIELKPTCKMCGKPLTYSNGKFLLYCSKKCSNSDIENKKQKMIEKYGVTNVWQLDSVKNKIDKNKKI